MIKLLTYLLWWIQRVFERLISEMANLSKGVIKHIDSYQLPRYANPFIEAAAKPPTLA